MFDVNHENRVVGLSLSFHERFEKLVNEANNIIIEYKRVYRYEGKTRNLIFEIANVCGYISPANIYNELSQFCDAKFYDMATEIKPMWSTQKIIYLTTIKNAFENLLSIVSYKQLIKGITADGTYDNFCYTAFNNPTFVGSSKQLSDEEKIDILCKTSKFADSFVRVIKDSIFKLNNIIMQLEIASSDCHVADSLAKYDTTKFKTPFSVSELAYLFRILSEENIIQVPTGKNEAFFRFITDSLSSKNAANISPNSFKNKFHNPESKAAETIHTALMRLLQRANKDR